MECPQKSSHTSDTRIMFVNLRHLRSIFRDDQCTEFKNSKSPAGSAAPSLGEKNRRPRVEKYEDRNQAQRGQANDNRDEGDNDIGKPLEAEIAQPLRRPPLQRRGLSF